MRWLLLLTAALLVELCVVWQVGLRLGFWPMIGLMMATGLLGGALAKREGLRVWRDWNAALQHGSMPEVGLVDGLLVLLGGVLLLAPGLLGDVFGLLLLFPPSRRVAATLVRGWLEKRMARVEAEVAQGGGHSPFSSFTVTSSGGGFPFPPGFGLHDQEGPREDRDIVVIETTGEVVEEPERAPLALPPGR